MHLKGKSSHGIHLQDLIMYMKTFKKKKTKKNPEVQNTPDPIISAKNSQPVFCLLGEITPYTKDSTA